MSLKRIEILGEDEFENEIHNERFYDDEGNEVLRIDTEVDTDQSGNPSAGIRVNNPENNRVSLLTGNGILANGGGYPALPPSTGGQTNASIVGIINDRNSDPNGISAGVIGTDNTGEETPGSSMTFGGFFTSILTWALNIGSITLETETSYIITKLETFLSCYNDNELTIYLPANPFTGRLIFIRRNNSDPIIINGNGHKILDTVPRESKTLGSSGAEGELAILFWDGSNWTYNRFGR